jgi:hypothetical protein
MESCLALKTKRGGMRMDQLAIIEYLRTWLQQRLGHRLTIKSDHVGAHREELALYRGPKLRGGGRRNRLSQVDLIGLNEHPKLVEIIVEVDPDSTPKKLLGDFTPIALADNHTPSNRLDGYKLENVAFFFLTILSDRSSSSKTMQYRLIEPAVRELFAIPSKKLKHFHLCYGQSAEEAITDFQTAIEMIYFPSTGNQS